MKGRLGARARQRLFLRSPAPSRQAQTPQSTSSRSPAPPLTEKTPFTPGKACYVVCRRMRRTCAVTVACLAFGLLAGCRRDEQIQIYQTPKENVPPAAAAPAMAMMGADAVPAPANSTPPHWTTPSGWQEMRPNLPRLGDFVVSGPDGKKAEVTVMTFPGDVGGVLANVNRWRQRSRPGQHRGKWNRLRKGRCGFQRRKTLRLGGRLGTDGGRHDSAQRRFVVLQDARRPGRGGSRETRLSSVLVIGPFWRKPAPATAANPPPGHARHGGHDAMTDVRHGHGRRACRRFRCGTKMERANELDRNHSRPDGQEELFHRRRTPAKKQLSASAFWRAKAAECWPMSTAGAASWICRPLRKTRCRKSRPIAGRAGREGHDGGFLRHGRRRPAQLAWLAVSVPHGGQTWFYKLTGRRPGGGPWKGCLCQLRPIRPLPLNHAQE